MEMPAPLERRLAERFDTNVVLTCRAPARPCSATLHDISYDGCRIHVPRGTLELGATVLIDLPGARGFAGSVVWVKRNQAGIRFLRRLGKTSAVALGLEQAEPVVPEPKPEATRGLLHHWVRRLMKLD